MIYAIASCYDHAELIPHFLDHYTRLGVDRTFIVMRGLERDYKEAQTYAKPYGRKVEVYRPHSSRWVQDCKYFSDQDKSETEAAILALEGITSKDWIMHLDLDEFQQYPLPLDKVIELLERGNYLSCQGKIIDRVATSDSLEEVKQEPSIFEQFPVECNLTSGLLGGWTRKAMLVRGDVKLREFARHEAEVPVSRVYTASGYRVSHFKWISGLDGRLSQRLKKGNTLHPKYRAECEKFLAHWIKEKRLTAEKFK